jgi:hypothetical protein
MDTLYVSCDDDSLSGTPWLIDLISIVKYISQLIH